MISTENELMMKMCNSSVYGIGCKVNNNHFYFFEDFEDDDAITRIYRQFPECQIIFYSMQWARQKRIEELFRKYVALPDTDENKAKLELTIARCINNWSKYKISDAIKQIRSNNIHYASIMERRGM